MSAARRATLRLAAGCAIIASGCGGTNELSPDEQAAKNLEVLRGVPRSTELLGRESAPQTLTVYARLDDLRLARLVNDTLPALVQRYVRPGKLKIRLRTLSPASGSADDGSDARTLAEYAQAAGLDNRLWTAVGSMEARYVGVVDDEFRTSLAADLGVPAAQLTARVGDPRVSAAIDGDNTRSNAIPARRFTVLLAEGEGSPRRLPTKKDAILAAVAGRTSGGSTSSNSKSAAPASNATTTTTTTSTTATTSITTTGIAPTQTTSTVPARGRVIVQNARVLRATSRSGLRRNRARLRLIVTVRNPGATSLILDRGAIYFADKRLRRDSLASGPAGALARPIAPRSSATGELRFETAGPTTTKLLAQKTVRLVIGGRSVTTEIEF